MGVDFIKKYENLIISKSGNNSEQGLSKYLIDEPKMAQFSKFKFIFVLKWNFNGGEGVNFIKKYENLVISKCRKSQIKLKWLRVLAVEMNSRVCKDGSENEMSFD